MNVAPARRVALKALARVRRDEAFSGPVLASELASAALSPADAALATRLTYGVLAAVGVLDDAIDRHTRGSLEPRVRDALRLAAFEMLFGRAPAYAVVDQAVETVRVVRPQAASLANAVMRRLSEVADAFPWGDPKTDRDALARASAHPRWIVDLALADLGEEAGREMLACGLEPAPIYARLNPFAGDVEETLGSLAAAGPLASPPDDDCYRLENPVAAFRGVRSTQSWFPMDAAAQMAPRACAPAEGRTILDVGAGRGNKTVCLQAIAVRSGGAAAITALDVHPGKIASLRTRLDASGVPGAATIAADADHLRERYGPDAFDVVLLDAPCSGLGTLRRYPEKRWRIGPDTPVTLSRLQLGLLNSSASVVRSGGCVVYSTCSVAGVENGGVITEFLNTPGGAEYVVEPLGDAVPAEWSGFLDGQGCFQSWPTSGGPDGHYVAVLRRNHI